MNKILFVVAIVAAVFVVYLAVSAFNEPAALPPAGNVPAPVNVGSARQSKAGDLELENLKARQGIELGGVLRTTWPDVDTADCAWEGTRCHCASDESSAGNMRIILGVTCASGQVTDFSIVDFQISSRRKNCRGETPTGCTAGLYTRN